MVYKRAAAPRFWEYAKLYTVDVDGGKLQPVTPEVDADPLNKFSFCWSPDGKRIAYVWQKNRDASARSLQKGDWKRESFLTIADADGKNPVTLSSKKVEGGKVTFGSIDWR